MDLLKNTIEQIKPVNPALMDKAQARLDSLTKPRGSLGRLEEFAKRAVAITGIDRPVLKRKVIFTMAGDHGVADEGVSLYPKDVTYQMVANFVNGGAGINVLARHAGAEVVVVDMGVAKDLEICSEKLKIKKIAYGTKNMAKGPAMTRAEAVKSIEAGIEVFEEEFRKTKIDIAGTGDMGIANTTPSSAIISAVTGEPCARTTGRGTGIGDEQLKLKIGIIERSIKVNAPRHDDPLDILSKVGGFEIGGICGLILGAAKRRVPIVVDGFISTAGALLAYKLSAASRDYMFASHRSQERGHIVALDHMALVPVLDLDMRLGEGTGSALAIMIIEAGVKIYNEMATFGEASVSQEKT